MKSRRRLPARRPRLARNGEYREIPANVFGSTATKLLLAAAVVLVATVGAVAERNPIKPADFQPLTSLPWLEKGAKLAKVIERIFLEPNPRIRYPVLGEYLRLIPVDDWERAFDLCVKREESGDRGQEAILD